MRRTHRNHRTAMRRLRTQSLADRQRAHVVSTDGDAGRLGSEERVDVEHRAVRAGREGAMDVDLQTVPRTQADALAKATIEAGPRLVEPTGEAELSAQQLDTVVELSAW